MLLSINNLDVSYGEIRALEDVTLEIEAGEIVTLIGANGAGKSTLLRTISGLIRPTRGSIRFDQPAGGGNHEQSKPGIVEYSTASASATAGLHHLKPHEIVALGISHVPEGRQIFPDLTVLENLKLGAYQRTDADEIRQSIEHGYELFPILAERRAQQAGTLSGGEQQMLAIARALMAKPRLLLLDEPSLGLAPLIVRRIFDIIKTINAGGTTVFLVEQNARMALAIANRGYVLQTGRVILSDKAPALLENDDVKKAYLGG